MPIRPTTPRAVLLLPAVALIATLAGLRADGEMCNAKAPVSIALTTNEAALANGGVAALDIRITPESGLAGATLHIGRERGDVQVSGTQTWDFGPLAAGASIDVSSTIQLSGKGHSVLRATFEALDEHGQRVFLRSKALHLFQRGDAVAAGDTNEMTVKFQLADRLSKTRDAREELIESMTNAPAHTRMWTTPGANKQTTTTITGELTWTDQSGQVQQVAGGTIDVFDVSNGLASATMLFSGDVEPNGQFEIFDNEALIADGMDIAIRARTDSDSCYIHPPGQRNVRYTFTSDTMSGVSAGSTLNFQINISTEEAGGQAFGVMTALYWGARYAGAQLSLVTEQLPVEFPGSNRSSSYFTSDTSISIRADDWVDWDVILHEYGHYVQDLLGINSSAQGSHFLTQNLAEALGKSDGIALAWKEGFASFYSIASQVPQLSTFTIPLVGNTTFTDTIDVELRYDIESGADLPGVGEDNELSVSRILHDLADGPPDAPDQFSLGSADVIYRIERARARNLSTFWNALITGEDDATQVRYGCLFQEHKVAPEPLTPEDGANATAGEPLEFTWNANGAGESFRLNRFRVRFFDDSYSRVVFESDDIEDTTWTPTQGEWDSILGGAQTLRWVVEGFNTDAPETGGYISCGRILNGPQVAFVIDTTGSMREEIAAVRSALARYISNLSDGEAEPRIALYTFSDFLRSALVFDSAAEALQGVSQLFALGGEDCPEAGMGALLFAVSDAEEGARILFATDASSKGGFGLTSQVLTLAQEKDIQINTLLSGFCTTAKQSEAYTLDTANPADYRLPETPCNTPEDCGEGTPKTNTDCEPGEPCFDGIEPESEIILAEIPTYSQLSTATGGTFAFIPEVNTPGEEPRYENTAFNIITAGTEPAVIDATPPRANQGTTLNVRFTGGNTAFNGTSEVTVSGDGITVESGAALNASTFLATLTIDANATLGFRDVSVVTETADDLVTATGAGALRVEATPAAPLITSVQPPEAARGSVVDVVITGAETTFDASTMVNFGSAITVSNVQVLSSSEVTATLTVPDTDEVLGFHDVTVVTGAEVAVENAPGPFLVHDTIGADEVPALQAIAPAYGARGTGLALSVTGVNTSFENGVTMATFAAGSGITVEGVRVTSSTSLTMEVRIADSAPPAFVDLFITTRDERLVERDALEITADTPNRRPIANAGMDQVLSVDSGGTALVTLDGSASTDADGSILTFTWIGTPQPDATVQPTVTLPPGEHIFTLMVTDDDGAISDGDTVVITVTEAIGSPVLEITPESTLDFGRLDPGTNYEETVIVANIGSGTLSGTATIQSGDSVFFLASGSSFELGPGMSASISIVVDGNALVPGSAYSGFLQVTTSAGDTSIALGASTPATSAAGCGQGGGSRGSRGGNIALVLLVAAVLVVSGPVQKTCEHRR